MSERVHRDLTASGVRLRLADEGSGDPVVLLHDLFADHSTWEGVMRELEGEFRFVAPDLPGFGESEKPPARRYRYGIHTFAEAIADLYAALGLGRAALVGHGLGGAVAIAVAAQHPELVSRLVLVDAMCYSTAPDLAQRAAALPVLGNLLFKQLIGKATFRALLSARSHSPALGPRRVDRYYDAFNTPAARGSALATLRDSLDSRSVEAYIARIQTPSLVVWGRNDRVYRAGFGQRLAREIRGAGFELLDAGHAPQEELPAEVAGVIQRFLRAERPSAY